MTDTFQPVEYMLTCGSWQEAQRIADELLGKRLIACAECMDIQSRYLWKGSIDHAHEVKLLMKGIASSFSAIEQVVTRLHSYETFVLEQIPVQQLSAQAATWLETELMKVTMETDR